MDFEQNTPILKNIWKLPIKKKVIFKILFKLNFTNTILMLKLNIDVKNSNKIIIF